MGRTRRTRNVKKEKDDIPQINISPSFNPSYVNNPSNTTGDNAIIGNETTGDINEKTRREQPH